MVFISPPLRFTNQQENPPGPGPSRLQGAKGILVRHGSDRWPENMFSLREKWLLFPRNVFMGVGGKNPVCFWHLKIIYVFVRGFFLWSHGLLRAIFSCIVFVFLKLWHFHTTLFQNVAKEGISPYFKEIQIGDLGQQCDSFLHVFRCFSDTSGWEPHMSGGCFSLARREDSDGRRTRNRRALGWCVEACWKRLLEFWSTLSPIIYGSVENGHIWKATILLETSHFPLPWLWKEG